MAKGMKRIWNDKKKDEERLQKLRNKKKPTEILKEEAPDAAETVNSAETIPEGK